MLRQTSWKESNLNSTLVLYPRKMEITLFSSQAEVKKCYDRIKKLSEQDQLSILRKEVKLKKVMFSEMPSDFVYF